MRSFLLLWILGACNQAFGIEETAALPDADMRPDRDRDGLADVIDECIVPEIDAIADWDDDDIPASMDPCPYSRPGPDVDLDGVQDDCDPFQLIAGDRHLCTMAFGSVEVNSELWQPRPGEQVWAVADGYMMAFASKETPTSVISAERIVPTTGTITMDVGWSAIPVSAEYALVVWVSAGTERSASDVSCVFGNGPTSFGTVVRVGDTDMSAPSLGPIADPEKPQIARVQLQPGKAGLNLTCRVGYTRADNGESHLLVTGGHFDGELREQGFAAGDGALILYNLITYHTVEQPPLL